MSAILREDMTLAERVRAVHHRLILIHTACAADDSDITPLPEDVFAAIYSASAEALAILRPLGTLPGGVANWQAPDAEVLQEKGGWAVTHDDTELALLSERVSAHVVAAVALEDAIEIMRAEKGDG